MQNYCFNFTHDKFTIMRKLFFIVSIILSIHSCGQSQGTISSTTLSINDTFDVMLDSTSSWQQVVEATSSLIDSLSLIADDQTSLRNRMAAQQWGYMAIELLEERYSEIKESGKEVNYDDIPPLFDRIYAMEIQLKQRLHEWICHNSKTNGKINFVSSTCVCVPQKAPQKTRGEAPPPTFDGSLKCMTES